MMHDQQPSIALEQLSHVQDLYEKGMFLQAYDASKELGPLSQWQGPEATILASRLAGQLGGAILSRWLIRRAWRQYPNHGLVRDYYAYQMADSRGPYATWRWMQKIGEPSGNESEKQQADWYAMFGCLAAGLQDFDTAESWLERAAALAPTDPWIVVCRALAFEHEDRYDEALATSLHALELAPYYCPALIQAAHQLTLLDRDEEAVQLLTDASERLESMQVVTQLCTIHIELRQYKTAESLLNACVALAPLADRFYNRWLASRRSDISYHLGNVQDSRLYAQQVGPGFYQSVAVRLENHFHDAVESVLLPVGFVRQHRMTCVPATLSAISRFWSQPADHLEVAEEICYNGTTWLNERRWAESHGWVVREFTITEDSASQLLNRGVPFTFTTVEPGCGHLQAIIGCDKRRGTFWIRDPFWRNTCEAVIDTLLKKYRAFGPRGMALVPAAEHARFDGLDLPDASRWDQLHRLDAALDEHRRDDAQAIFDQIIVESDSHPIGYAARHRLACYDANPTERLAAVEMWLKTSPEDPCLQLDRLTCLRDLSQRDERVSIFKRLCEKRDVHPVFLQQYAQELRADARQWDAAVTLLQRAIRRAPGDAGNYHALANVYWDQRRFAEAFELYRFATCLNDKDESFADSYFRAARWFKKTDEALVFLRRRFDRFGKRSSLPARTLIQAYFQCDRTTKAIETVEEAMRFRPHDGELGLFAADCYLACSREHLPTASALLKKVKGIVPHAQWLRTAAKLAAHQDRAKDALKLWLDVLTLQPLAIDAHQAIVQLLVEVEGKPAALAHLANACHRFPHYWPLYQLWLQWVQDEPPTVRESIIREVIEKNPNEAWLHRELTLYLLSQGRVKEARAEIELAGLWEPNVPVHYGVLGQLLQEEGKIEEAKAAYRNAIRLSVDYRQAIEAYMAIGGSTAERRDFLLFVKDELIRQVTFGDGLLVFRVQASGTLGREELLKVLQQALQERPDLWHAWSACIQQLLMMDRREEAWELACQATDRFPLIQPLYLDRALACHAREDWNGEEEALQLAYRINPDSGESARALADYYERQGKGDRTQQILERLISRQPLDAINHIQLAEVLWRRQEKDAAMARVSHAIEITPEYDRAWADLRAWSNEVGRQEIAVDVARKLTERRSGEVRSWLILGNLLDGPDQVDQRLETLDKVLERNPRLVQAYDLKIVALSGVHRWEEARQACCPAAWGDNPPVELKGRGIWLTAQQGDLRDAIKKMQELLVSEPGYYTGWCWLWEWHQAMENYASCIQAGEMLVQLNPQYEIGLGYLAEANRLAGNLHQAEELFQRAFELNPRYENAGLMLFDLQMSADRVDRAAKTLALLQRYSNNAFVQARVVHLEAFLSIQNAGKGLIPSVRRTFHRFVGKDYGLRDAHREKSIACLQAMCMTACKSPWPVAFAAEMMVAAGWNQSVKKILQNLLYVEGAHEEVGRQWVRFQVAQGRWPSGRRLHRLLEQREAIGTEATVAYIEILVQNKRKATFRRFLWWNKCWLYKHDRTWAGVVYAMINFQFPMRDFLRWMKDWRRKNPQLWMLDTMVESLRKLGRDAEASEVSRYALTLPGRGLHDLHRSWLAADAVCRRDWDVARQMLAELAQPPATAGIAFTETMVATVIKMLLADSADKPSTYQAVRQDLRSALTRYQFFSHDPARKRLFRKCIRLISKSEGSWKAKVWYCFRWFFSL